MLVALAAGSVFAETITENFDSWTIGDTTVQGATQGDSGISTWNTVTLTATNGIAGFEGNVVAMTSGDNRYGALRVYLNTTSGILANAPVGSTSATISFDLKLEDLDATTWPLIPTSASVRATGQANVTEDLTQVSDLGNGIFRYSTTFDVTDAQAAASEFYAHFSLGTGPDDGGKLPAEYQGVTMGYVDNVTVTVVPEPATIGMLGMGALLALLVRRMRA